MIAPAKKRIRRWDIDQQRHASQRAAQLHAENRARIEHERVEMARALAARKGVSLPPVVEAQLAPALTCARVEAARQARIARLPERELAAAFAALGRGYGGLLEQQRASA